MKRIFKLTSLVLMTVSLAGCSGSDKPKHRHEWGDPTYAWANDYSSCTATRVCTLNENHIQTETKSSTRVTVTPATCLENGLARYTVDFDNSVFETQTEEVTINATGHTWGAASYEWSDDHKTCTATRVCTHDGEHTETETSTSTFSVTQRATEDAAGVGVYSAIFTNPAFEAQSIEVSVAYDTYATVPEFDTQTNMVRFGLYPQSVVRDSNLIAALNSDAVLLENGWYKYNEGYFAKIVAKLFNSALSEFSDNVTYWCKCETIMWRVVTHNNYNLYTLMAEKILDAQYFYSSTDTRTIGGHTIYPNNYCQSDLNKFMKGEFLNTAFSLSGTSVIEYTSAYNSPSNSNSSTNPYCQNNDTTARAYLPSYLEMVGPPFNSDSIRQSHYTDWTELRGLDLGAGVNEGFASYWTRSPASEGASLVSIASAYGDMFKRGVTNKCGVRPWINIYLSNMIVY